MDTAELLRTEALRQGSNPYRISRDSDIPVSIIQKWYKGGGLRPPTAERIAAALGVRIRIVLERVEGK